MVYVSGGASATQIPRSQLMATCDHWEIWLFRNGAALPSYGSVSNSAAHWGTINGKSEQAVEAQLKRSQAFDKVWDKAAGIPFASPNDLDDENPVGPICIVSRPVIDVQQRLRKLDEISQNLAPLQSAAIYAWDHDPNANEELREYIRNLRMMQQTQSRIFDMLNTYLVTPNLNAIDGELSQLSSGLYSAQQVSARSSAGSTPQGSKSAPLENWASRVQSYQVGYPLSFRVDQNWTADSDGQGLSVYTVMNQSGQTRRFQLDIRLNDIFNVSIPRRGAAVHGWGSITLGFKTPKPETNTASSSAMTLYFNTQSEAQAAYRYFSSHVATQ
jgi:hypothetical protein